MRVRLQVFGSVMAMSPSKRTKAPLQLSTFLIDTRTILDAFVLKCKPNATSRDDRLSILLDSEEADKLLLEAKVTDDDVLELYPYTLISLASQAAHSFNGNRMREALLANPSLCASMDLSPKVVRTIESLFSCLVGGQNLGEVLPTPRRTPIGEISKTNVPRLSAPARTF